MGRISSAVRIIDGRIYDVISSYAKASPFFVIWVLLMENVCFMH